MSELITWNANDMKLNYTLSDRNLKATKSGGDWGIVRATEGRNKGRWYWEIEIGSFISSLVGIATKDSPLSPSSYSRGAGFRMFRHHSYAGYGLLIDNSYGNTPPWGTVYAGAGDVIGVALNVGDGYIGYYLNGELLGRAFDDIDTLGEVYPTASMYGTGTQTANFGATPFKHFTEELMEEGYLPYDYDNAHIDNIPYQLKHLLKVGSEMRILSEDREALIFPLLEGLSQEEIYDKWGMDNLIGYEDVIDKIRYEMVEDGKIGDGRVIRKVIKKNEFAINKLEVK